MNEKVEELGSYWKDISNYEPLSRSQEVELFEDYKQNDNESALTEIVNCNLRFVVSIAKEYTNYGMTLPELISEGNMGLMEAAHRFDETRGFKFITYAVWWIRQAILKSLSENATTKLPANSHTELVQISNESEVLSQQLFRDPTLEEIADSMGKTVGEVRDKVSREQARASLSLDYPAYEDNDKTFKDVIPDENYENAEEILETEELHQELNDALETMDEREQNIFRMYFGLDGEKPMTLEQIGNVLGLTRERIRQLRDRELKKLRRSKFKPLRLLYEKNENKK